MTENLEPMPASDHRRLHGGSTEDARPWYVYDPPNYVLGRVSRKGTLYGPFLTQDAAYEYANVLYPEDGTGEAVILQAVKP